MSYNLIKYADNHHIVYIIFIKSYFRGILFINVLHNIFLRIEVMTMLFCYESDRLILKVLQQDSARLVLEFYKNNRAIFEPLEPAKDEIFYTEKYQSKLLSAELKNFLSGRSVRFFVFTKDNPNEIIGTVSFNSINRGAFNNCQIGYKFDKGKLHKGYAIESVNKAVQIAILEMNIHRIEAYILPDNEASIKLIKKAGFVSEGMAFKYAKLINGWQDHLRYVYIAPDDTELF